MESNSVEMANKALDIESKVISHKLVLIWCSSTLNGVQFCGGGKQSIGYTKRGYIS